jgi:methionyl-tRNA formyltransferase
VRLVFLGTPEAAVPSLLRLLDAGHEIVAAVTRPDRPVGRSRRPVAPPVKRLAVERGLAVLQPRRVRGAAFREELQSLGPDALIVVAYGRILPPPVLEIGEYGAINLHFSLLPRYRGAAPVQWALARGEAVTGVTTMQVAPELDTGAILFQREVAVESGEHAPALERRLAQIGAELLSETLAALSAGRATPRPQDPAAATEAPLLRVEDGWISPEWAASEIEGRVRGFDPWPGAWLRHRGRRLRVVEAHAVAGDATDAPAGTLVEEGRGLVMACGGGSRLLLSRIQPEGRRPLAVRDALNGRHVAPGDRFERLESPG